METVSTTWLALMFTASGILCTVVGLFLTRIGKAKQDGSEMANIIKDIEYLRETKINSDPFIELKKDLQYLIQDFKSLRKMLEDNDAVVKENGVIIRDDILKLHERINNHIKKYHST